MIGTLKLVIGGLAAVGIGSQVMRVVSGATGEGEELSAADRLSWTTDLIQKLGRMVNHEPEPDIQYVDEQGNPTDQNGNPMQNVDPGYQQQGFDPYDPYSQQPQQSQQPQSPTGYVDQFGNPVDKYGYPVDQYGRRLPGRARSHGKTITIKVDKKKPKKKVNIKLV